MRRSRGMTVLELMIVIAIIGGLVVVASGGLRRLTKADLVDDTLEVASVMRRTGQLALETGQLHRIVFDFDKREYAVEVCQGAGTVMRGQKQEERAADPRDVQDKIETARQRLSTAGGHVVESSDADDAAKKAAALAGHHVLDRVCVPAPETPAPGAKKIPIRKLRDDIKLREVWVQHLDDSTTGGVVSIHFFPIGSAEKAIVEVGNKDGDVFTILVHGLSGRVEVRDEAIRNADDHMLRNAKGDKEDDR